MQNLLSLAGLGLVVSGIANLAASFVGGDQPRLLVGAALS